MGLNTVRFNQSDSSTDREFSRRWSLSLAVMVYVALLRGINVGGKNKVDMRQLKATVEEVGLTEVSTYINSGNVVFKSSSRNRAELVARLEAAIKESFGFPVSVLLRDRAAMQKVAKALPNGWTNDDVMRCDVLFLWRDFDRASIIDDLPIRPEIEDVFYVPGAVIWRVDRVNQMKSRLSRVVGTPLYKGMTIRNCNTVRKLVEMMEAVH